MNGRVIALLSIVAITGCASRALNHLPEPRVVEIASHPTHAAVDIDCGNGDVDRGTTPMRVDVPAEDRSCALTIAMPGYRSLHLKLNRSMVLQMGEPQRIEEHHELDASATPEDVFFYPFQRIGDAIQNAAMRELVADWKVEVRLMPIPAP